MVKVIWLIFGVAIALGWLGPAFLFTYINFLSGQYRLEHDV
jgi:hypothetical protein